MDLLWRVDASPDRYAVHQAQRTAALQGAAHHSRGGAGDLRVFDRGAHHRQAADRVPICGAVHRGGPHLLHPLRPLRHRTLFHG